MGFALYVLFKYNQQVLYALVLSWNMSPVFEKLPPVSKFLSRLLGTFLSEVNNRETIGAIEPNNDTYCLPKSNRKVPSDTIHKPLKFHEYSCTIHHIQHYLHMYDCVINIKSQLHDKIPNQTELLMFHYNMSPSLSGCRNRSCRNKWSRCLYHICMWLIYYPGSLLMFNCYTHINRWLCGSSVNGIPVSPCQAWCRRSRWLKKVCCKVVLNDKNNS